MIACKNRLNFVTTNRLIESLEPKSIELVMNVPPKVSSWAAVEVSRLRFGTKGSNRVLSKRDDLVAELFAVAIEDVGR